VARPTVDRDQVRALRVLQRGFGRDQVEVADVRWNESPGDAGPPRYPPPRRPERRRR
jgi:hypothetical protein